MSLQLPCYDTVLFGVGYLICSARPSKQCVALRRLAVRAHRSDREESEREQAKCAPTRLRAARRGRGPAAKKEEKIRRDNGNIKHLVKDR